eukprot:9745237-Alexandrium_andersonii.AAC.1
MDDEAGYRSQEGWSAYADGAPTGSRGSAGSGGAWSGRSDGGLPASVGRTFRGDIAGAALPPELAMPA